MGASEERIRQLVNVLGGTGHVTATTKGDAIIAIQMDCYGRTDIGKKRSSNEDQFLIADLNKSLRVHQTSLGLDHQTRLFGGSQGHLLVVADGMGGCAAGERASTLAIDSVVSYVLDTLHWFYRLNENSEDDFRDDLKAALHHCQARLAIEMAAIPKREGMGDLRKTWYCEVKLVFVD